MENSESIRAALDGRAKRKRADALTPLDAAIAWVNAGGRPGPEREALLDAIDRPDARGFALPSGATGHREGLVLKAWKAAAVRAIAAADRGRGPSGGVMAPREPVTVWATAGAAARLRRGERVSIMATTMVEVGHG